MIGRDPTTIAALGVTAAIVCALMLTTPRPALAAPTNASTDTVDGVPCNSLCQAYMAWSNRVMAASHPRPPAQPQRTSAHPKTLERTRHRAPEAHHAALTNSARLPHRRVAPPRLAENPRVQTAPSEPVSPAAERPLPADATITASLASAAAASLTAPVSTAQALGPVDPATGGLDLQFALSLVFAFSLCAFLVLMLMDRSKDRPRAATAFR
jgi:hypothetical protein